MNEDSAVTCTFGTRPRSRACGPAVAFGSLAAIAPRFDALQPADQKAAVALMREAGERPAAIAAGLGRSLTDIEIFRDLRCRRIAMPGENDQQRSAGSQTSPNSQTERGSPRGAPDVVAEKALSDALAILDAHRVQCGAERSEWFEMTLESICQACGFSLDTARRRIRELESRRWIRRTVRAGQPPLLQIALAGRCRLTALAREGRS